MWGMDTFLDTALSRKYRSNLWCKWSNTNFRPMPQSALLSVEFVVVLIKPNNIMEGRPFDIGSKIITNVHYRISYLSKLIIFVLIFINILEN